MKKFAAILLVASLSMWTLAAYAVDVPVSAQVPTSTPGISITIKELTTAGQDPFTGTTVTSMSFGPLVHTFTDGTEAGVWFSQKYYAVIIFTNSFGQRYEIRSSCSGLTSGANSLPTGSFGLVPGYSSADRFVGTDPLSAQGAQPAGSSLGSAVSAITGAGLFRTVYTSELAASNRIIRAFYSLPALGAGGALPFPGYTSIPLSQSAGTYSGTVTITIAAI